MKDVLTCLREVKVSRLNDAGVNWPHGDLIGGVPFYHLIRIGSGALQHGQRISVEVAAHGVLVRCDMFMMHQRTRIRAAFKTDTEVIMGLAFEPVGRRMAWLNAHRYWIFRIQRHLFHVVLIAGQQGQLPCRFHGEAGDQSAHVRLSR